MDITPLFKACVKTVRTRNKAFGVGSDGDKSRILSNRSSKSEFTVRAKEVMCNITRLRDFMLEHRKAYLSFSTHLISDAPQMTTSERDQIDSGAQKIINTCSHLIQDFKKEAQKLPGKPQEVDHRHAVLELVEKYLKNVCKIYSEQKAIRVKRSLDMQKMSRLDSESFSSLKQYDNKSGKSSLNVKIANGTCDADKKDLNKEETEKKENRKEKKNMSAGDQDANFFAEEDRLSAEELQMFELENSQLYNELNSLADEVKQIEGKVVKIAELQEIFTDKVLQQEKDIERISTTVVGSTENVKDANEQIRQAIQRNAGLRVYILFFLLVMSFSLLFLDWYND